MTRVDVHLSCPIHDSFRVQHVAGMFDVPWQEKANITFSADVPSVDEPWQIGLIVGPSGSGKTALAKEAFLAFVSSDDSWPIDRAVVDGFGDLPMKQIVGLLTAVGFSSPPSWIKPYGVLSGGERFRCDLARVLARADSESRASGVAQLAVFDEFTSVVDRNVAQVSSAAISKAIRGKSLSCRFVAVSCHYDIAEWLEPDWMVDMATRTCQWRRLRRPDIELEIYRCRRDLWSLFAPHHYLSGRLSPTARCYVGMWKGTPVSFCASIPLIGRQRHWRVTRIVTLPDFQGVGIGTRMLEAVCDLHIAQGYRINATASHPAIIAHCKRSPRWRVVRVMRNGSAGAKRFIANYRGSTGRAVVSFEYLGGGKTRE